jgi:Carboxypeptidase regulatory-like domain
MKFLTLAAATLFFAALSEAQTTGVIVGRVTDSSGASIAKVNVELLNQNTGIKETTVGTSQGEYVFPRVDPGTYRLTATAPGFKTSVKVGVEILVNQTAREDISLTVGETSTSVQVAAELPVVQSETSSIGQVVDGAQVSQMPLNGRDSIYALLATIPGVQDSGSNPAIAGSAYRGGTAMTIDGASNDDALNERINLPVPHSIQSLNSRCLQTARPPSSESRRK